MKILRLIFGISLLAFGCGFCLFIFVPNLVVTSIIPQMPFGGVKASGYGRFGGKAGIEAFTELRWITIQTAPRHYPF